MQNKPTFGWAIFGTLLVIFGVVLASIPQAAGQTPVAGNNDVYNSAGTTQAPSAAFIDVTAIPQGSDMCQTIYRLLSGFTGYPTYPASGAVIDARGISGSALTCTSGTPWNESGTGYINIPSTILLPAQTIIIQQTWVLPSNTHLIGTGSTNLYWFSSPLPKTVIQACSNGCTLASMIQMGGATSCTPTCGTPFRSISIEDLSINGNNKSIAGIVNSSAEDQSYVKNVGLFQVLGTGLQISGNASRSGPYSNITYDTGNSGSTNSTCASITSVSGGTRGIHGLTCISSGNNSLVAITLDSSSNSLEDIRIAGFTTGIFVGSQEVAQSNILKNIWGDTVPPRGISSPPGLIVIASGSNVSDLAIIGVGNPISGTTTINDLVTGTSLSDTYIAMYALGESANNGFSRFTTSPNAVTWGVGSSAPGTGSCLNGSLYSCTGSSSNCSQSSSSYALWGCKTSIWQGIL